MKERYTSEEIWYEDAGVVTVGITQARRLIARVLSKIPKEITKRVLDECLILIPMIDYELGFFLPKKLLQDKCVIAFPESLLMEDEKRIEHTVLHEIAHFYLDHKSPIFEALSDKEAKKQEDEADRLADKWLREFEIDTEKKD